MAYSSLSQAQNLPVVVPLPSAALQLQCLWQVLSQEPACARRSAQLSWRHSSTASLKAACVTALKLPMIRSSRMALRCYIDFLSSMSASALFAGRCSRSSPVFLSERTCMQLHGCVSDLLP